ncbi:uncharacterized protein METZ01_LOCUS116800 [marine metagenome]|uniref:Uncharacterized protein n=1 Tax=marine metagenome TaxID=408172 RepID=A0A381XGS5_9ZZZZ
MGAAVASMAWLPNINEVADPPRLAGVRSIIQEWITGRTANKTNPRTAMPTTNVAR